MVWKMMQGQMLVLHLSTKKIITNMIIKAGLLLQYEILLLFFFLLKERHPEGNPRVLWNTPPLWEWVSAPSLHKNILLFDILPEFVVQKQSNYSKITLNFAGFYRFLGHNHTQEAHKATSFTPGTVPNNKQAWRKFKVVRINPYLSFEKKMAL